MKLLEKEFERPQGQGMWSVTKKTMIHSPSREIYIMFVNIGVLRLHSTD